MVTMESGGYRSIADFYAGQSAFITGGTGFLGKALIEKLLYSCEDIANIYILIRDKKGVSVQDRLKQMFDKPIFSRLMSEKPQALKKIIPISGDIAQPGLGISPADQEILIEKVSVVFHVAATIRFNEKLEVAVNTNVKGTAYVLDLCHLLKNIKAFIHVSTAYCNTDHKVLEEKLYPPRADLGEVLKYMVLPQQDEQYIREEFFKGLPNTYTFTKGLSENYIEKHCRNLPAAIVRPSIVCSALNEPVSGWTDNWMGATGLTIASVKGANRVIYGNGDNILDIIPVDYVCNAIIVAAVKCSRSNKLPVYNCCTSSCNPVSIEKFVDGVKRSAIKTEFGVNPNQSLIFTKSRFMLFTLTLLLQTIPAYLVDCYRWLIGKQTKYVKLQSRVIMARSVLEYFCTHSWEMKADNVTLLHASLSHSDKKTFPCDPSDINWDQYTAVFLAGVRTHLLSK